MWLLTIIIIIIIIIDIIILLNRVVDKDEYIKIDYIAKGTFILCSPVWRGFVFSGVVSHVCLESKRSSGPSHRVQGRPAGWVAQIAQSCALYNSLPVKAASWQGAGAVCVPRVRQGAGRSYSGLSDDDRLHDLQQLGRWRQVGKPPLRVDRTGRVLELDCC